ncbi:Hypothetical predicted protein [Paramuricea clavata]|uniref:Uncharacterized protein n=1 Tax=Paramuricea clavata TaxID=317549 RepID=A0A6S7HJ05_PARCT|nr:Hypothetical predicted protein [Paramuricea clavata]
MECGHIHTSLKTGRLQSVQRFATTRLTFMEDNGTFSKHRVDCLSLVFMRKTG